MEWTLSEELWYKSEEMYVIGVSLLMRLTTLHLVSFQITTVDDFAALA